MLAKELRNLNLRRTSTYGTDVLSDMAFLAAMLMKSAAAASRSSWIAIVAALLIMLALEIEDPMIIYSPIITIGFAAGVAAAMLAFCLLPIVRWYTVIDGFVGFGLFAKDVLQYYMEE